MWLSPRANEAFGDIDDKVGDIIKDVHRVISFGIGRNNDERVERELFDDGDAWREFDMAAYSNKAVAQLGTVGSGNHYVDAMRDEEDLFWIGVHFGSRGLGHTSATRYLKAAGGRDGMNVPPAVIDEDSEIGRRYIAAMQFAGRYAYAGREWVIECVRKIIGGAITEFGCTTTTTMPGAKTTAAGICGWSARERRRHSPTSAALSADRWGMTP